MKKGYVIVSTDEYKGIPVQKCKFENGNIMYFSCSMWFEDFADFMESVDVEPEDFEEAVEDEIMREFDEAFGMPLAQIDEMIMDTFFKR